MTRSQFEITETKNPPALDLGRSERTTGIAEWKINYAKDTSTPPKSQGFCAG
jgi:hypothetical protein